MEIVQTWERNKGPQYRSEQETFAASSVIIKFLSVTEFLISDKEEKQADEVITQNSSVSILSKVGFPTDRILQRTSKKTSSPPPLLPTEYYEERQVSKNTKTISITNQKIDFPFR